MELDTCTCSRLWGAEADPNSSETLEHLKGHLVIIDPEESFKPLLGTIKKGTRISYLLKTSFIFNILLQIN